MDLLPGENVVGGSVIKVQIEQPEPVSLLKCTQTYSRRGDLLGLSRTEVQQRGYKYVKGKSHSKRFMSPPLETPKATRSKVSAEVRQQRIRSLEEDIANIDKQLHFKNKRLQQAENIKNYKLCEEINEEMHGCHKTKA